MNQLLNPGTPQKGWAGAWKLPAFAVVCCVLLLAGCFTDEKVAGGDDFPNSVSTLGKAAATEGSDSTSWNGYEEAPATPPEVYDSTEVPDDAPDESLNKPGASLNKSAAKPDGWVPPGKEIAGAARAIQTLLDPITGLNRLVRVQKIVLGLAVGDTIVARDTTWYRTQGLPLVRRMVKMSGVVTYPVGRVERFTFEDADGDELLAPQPNSRNLARARFVVEHALGRVEERTVIMAAGPDRVFGTPDDNALRMLDVVQRVGTDTLLVLKLRPVGADSSVRDGGRDSSRVDVERITMVAGVRVVETYRSVVRKDSLRNRAERYRRVTTTAAGVTEFEPLGRDSVSDFTPGDTGIVRVRFTSTRTTDTLASSLSLYRVRLSDSAGKHDRNRLLRVDTEKVYRLGAIAASRARLWPTVPVAPGAFVREGDLDLRVDLRQGGWVGYVGTLSATGFVGTWTDSTGAGGAVRFNAAGAIANP